MTINYRRLIQEEREYIRSERITKARNKFYGTSKKSPAQLKREEEEYKILERKFWS